MHSGKLNWTEQLNWTELDRSVQFSAVHWTGDALRRPATAVAGPFDCKELATAVTSRRSSSPVFVRRQTLHWLADSRSRECPPIVKNLRRSPISSPNQCTAGNWTELNWTELNRWCNDLFTCLLQWPRWFLKFNFLATVNSSHNAFCRTVNSSVKNSCDELTVWRVDWQPVELSWVQFLAVHWASVILEPLLWSTLALWFQWIYKPGGSGHHNRIQHSGVARWPNIQKVVENTPLRDYAVELVSAVVGVK